MTNQKVSRVWAVAVPVVVIIGILVTWKSLTTVRGAAVETQLPELIKSLKGDEYRLAAVVLESYREYRGNAQQWSLGYHGLTILAAALSAMAGVVLKLELWLKTESLKKDLAAVFAATAALLITITTTVGFERKWQANRLAAAEVEAVALELVTLDEASRRQSLRRLGDRLRRVSLARHLEVIGTRDEDAVNEEKIDAGALPGP